MPETHLNDVADKPTQNDSCWAQRPPDAPREIGPRAARRGWLEGRVRVWWMAGGVLLMIGMWLIAWQLIGVFEDRDLIRNGVLVTADITHANDSTRLAAHNPEDRAVYTFTFTMPDQREHTIHSRLPNQREALGPASTVELYVDPANLDRWTDRTEINILRDAMLGFALLPIGGLLLGAAALQRKWVLSTWRTGVAQEALVVNRRNSPIAPMSQTLELTLADGQDRRVFTAVVPTRLGTLEPGDMLWVVAPPQRPQQAVVAALYQQPR